MTLKEKLTACLEQAVENREAAGFNLLVLRNGKPLCYAEAGYADIESGKKIRRDSIFRLYSQTKPVTAAAALILADRGLLDLQTGVDKYLPGFANPRVVGTKIPHATGPPKNKKKQLQLCPPSWVKEQEIRKLKSTFLVLRI